MNVSKQVSQTESVSMNSYKGTRTYYVGPLERAISPDIEIPIDEEPTDYKGLVQLTLKRLMSYIYMEHPFLMFLDHTQRRSKVGRTPLDE